MSSAAPNVHMLNVPREIRDHIYSYLYRDIELATIGMLGASPVLAMLAFAPLPSVLLICKAIEAEYKEYFTRNISTIVYNRYDDLGGTQEFWIENISLARKDVVALAHAEDATIRFRPNKLLPIATVIDLLSDFIPRCPRLRILRIAERYNLEIFRNKPFPYDEAEYIVTTLPDTLAALDLCQRAHFCITNKGFVVHSPADLRRGLRSIINSLHASLHSLSLWYDEQAVTQYLVHLYTTPRVAKANFWTADKLMDDKVPRGFVMWSDQLLGASGATAEPKQQRVLSWKEIEGSRIDELDEEDEEDEAKKEKTGSRDSVDPEESERSEKSKNGKAVKEGKISGESNNYESKTSGEKEMTFEERLEIQRRLDVEKKEFEAFHNHISSRRKKKRRASWKTIGDELWPHTGLQSFGFYNPREEALANFFDDESSDDFSLL